MNIPLVFFDRSIKAPGFSLVAFDDYHGTLQAMNELVSAGYTKFAHFAGYSHTSIGATRKSGFTDALYINGIPLREDWIIEGGYQIEDGFKAFEKLRTTGKLPEVIVAVNDHVALGAYKAISKAGLKIPDDIGIIGYGFSETAEMFSPTLSVINQNPRKMGKIAVNILIDEIQSASIPAISQILIEEDFLWNSSVKNKKNRLTGK
jgi:DNA-binding LacI/PurR family transcriptional regulator